MLTKDNIEEINGAQFVTTLIALVVLGGFWRNYFISISFIIEWFWFIPIMVVGFILFRIIEGCAHDGDFSNTLSLFWITIVSFVIQWGVVLYITFEHWVFYSDLAILLFPNILFTYWVVIIAYWITRRSCQDGV
jgi:hypothetical protein